MDPEFEELEQKVMSLEVFLRQLIRNVNTWQEDLQVRLTFDPSPHKLHPLHTESGGQPRDFGGGDGALCDL